MKIPSLDLFERQRIANGDNTISTFIKIYLNAKLIISANDEKDSMAERIPSSEKASNDSVIVLFRMLFSETKDISFIPNVFSPRLIKNVEKRLVASNKNEQNDNELFINKPVKNALTKNLLGDSTGDSSCL